MKPVRSEYPPLTSGTFFHIYNRGNNGENIFVQERNYAYFMELWWKHTYSVFETWAYGLLRNHFHVAGYVKEKVSDLTGFTDNSVNQNHDMGMEQRLTDTIGDLSGLTGDSVNQNSRADLNVRLSDSRGNLSGLTGDSVNQNSRADLNIRLSDSRGNLSGLTGDSVNQNSRADLNIRLSDSRGDQTGLSKPFSNFFNAYARGVNIATGRTGALFERPFNRIPVTDENYLMRLIVYIHQNPQKHKFVTDFRDWNYSSYHALIGNMPTRLQREKVLQLFGSRADFIRIHQEIQPLQDVDDQD